VSSAILYVGIVAIWACVLIPRWLRRDSARGASSAAGGAVPGDEVAGDLVSDESGVSGLSGAAGVSGLSGAAADRAQAPPEAAERREDAPAAERPQDAPAPLTPEESRQRVLAARRRLLGMVLALEIAALALAVFGLAALWVVIPPSIMLGGYLLLLREAAHADAERAAREEEDARARARARQQARARARARAAQRPAATVAAPAPGYEDAGPGRDFAPGLAGKYTTSNAEVADTSEPAGDGYYEQYTETRLRAVGD
jgi:hypothetical protein